MLFKHNALKAFYIVLDFSFGDAMLLQCYSSNDCDNKHHQDILLKLDYGINGSHFMVLLKIKWILI